MTKKIELFEELDQLEEDQIILIVIGAKEYLKTNLEILSHLVKKRSHECIYISVNRPFENLFRLFKKNNINPEKFYFIDAISETIGSKKPRAENVIYISSPHGLTEVSIALAKAVDSIKGKEKFLFFDSISTLLIYNQAGTVAKFAHFLVGRARALQVKGILISLERETDEHLMNQMAQFVDKIITLNGK